MLEFISSLLTLWFFFMGVKLIFKMVWGGAKLAATVLLALALPALVLCLLFAGGVLLLIPVGFALAAFAVAKIFA